MTMDAKERSGMDVWDRLRQKMSRVAASQERPWNEHRNAPKPGEPLRRQPPAPGTQRRTAPTMPPNEGDQQWWQDRRIPRRVQERTDRSQWDGQDATSAYKSTRQDQDRLMRGAYQAGLNGDAGAAESFPAGSPFEKAYRQGLSDRQRGR